MRNVKELYISAEDVFRFATDTEYCLVRSIKEGWIRTNRRRADAILEFLEASLNETLGRFDEEFREAVRMRRYGRAKALTKKAQADSDRYLRIAIDLILKRGNQQ